MLQALVIDDDADFRDAIRDVVEQAGFSVETAATLEAARIILSQHIPDLALVDATLPDGDAVELLDDLASRPATEVVFVTAHPTVRMAIGAFRRGVADYLPKPVDLKHLRTILDSVTRRRALLEEAETLRAELRGLGRFGPLVGASRPMQDVYDRIARVAPTSATVLIEGESGTGKELVAQTIHRLSRRRAGSFVAVNCGAVSPELIESELFGHERGSFTGAARTHKGYFERAAGGTLLLDEITEMPLELQAKLLRALETQRIRRVGGESDIDTDVRILAATNRDADAAVAAGSLRSDLLYRLRVFPIHLPPLRERTGDVMLLAGYFLGQLNRLESTDKRFDRAAATALRAYPWPGNVRELRNAVHSAFIRAEDEIGAASLPPSIHAAPPSLDTGAPDAPLLDVPVGSSIAEVERRLILATLGACGGRKEETARALGISVKTLYNRLGQYRERARTNGTSTA
jgi:two-component system response regulator AtoC